MSVLTKFSKGIKESAALSFSRSATVNCDKGCKQLGNGCYAERVEKQYKDYGSKLVRHSRTLPENLLRLALNEVRAKPRLSWFRFSVSGSFPPATRIKNPAAFRSALRELVLCLLERGVLIHIPIESFAKARMLRGVLRELPVVIRRSCQSWRSLLQSKDSVSWVVPREQNPDEIADKLRNMGRSTVICPAIVGESKCGKCKACASPLVDIVLYPKHK